MGDRDAFQAYRTDLEVARYQSWDTPYTTEEAEEFVDEMLVCHPDTSGEWYQFAVALKADDQMIGDVALRIDEDDPAEAEIGYSLAAAASGKGYASEAVTAILDYALIARGKTHAIAWADTRNLRSLALLERLGFTRPEHPPRKSWFKGAWSEETFHRMMAGDWAKLRP
jgi:aminoglycoside 6'-N-acetyltransferase